jgi:hypothetical protein
LPEQVAPWLEALYPEHTMSLKTRDAYVFFHLMGELKKPALHGLRLRGKGEEKEAGFPK